MQTSYSTYGMNAFQLFLPVVSATIGGAMLFLPGLSARQHFFAITVPPEFRATEPAQASLRRYRMTVAFATAMALLLWSYTFAPALPGIIGLFAFLRERKAMQPYSVPVRGVLELHAGMDQLPGWTLLALPPFAALGGVAAFVRAQWNEIPERFAVHWGANGQPNGWATKSFRGVYGPLLFGAGLMVLLLLLGLATYYGARRGPQRAVTLKILIAMNYLLALIFGGVGLLPVMEVSPLLFLVATPLFLVAVIWWGMQASAMDPGESTPDECWHLGDIYYNPADPALFVQKRMGFGYTINFGNRLSWAVLGGFLAGVGGLMLLLLR